MRYLDCIFDLYGTLVDIHTDETRPEFWREMAGWYAGQGADYTPEALMAAYFQAVREGEAEMAAGDIPGGYQEIRLEAVFARLFREKGVDADPSLIQKTGRAFRRASLDYIRLYPGAKELLLGLRARGQRVHLLSNAQRMFTLYELEKLGLIPLFDSISISSDCGVKKPDPRFFRRLLQERGIDPSRAVMVGNDGDCDIRGAQAVGLATLYIRSNLSPAEPMPPADYILPQMDLGRVFKILTED